LATTFHKWKGKLTFQVEPLGLAPTSWMFQQTLIASTSSYSQRINV